VSWVTVAMAFVFVVVGVARVTSGSESPGRVASSLRGTFLVGLALCVAFTVLFVAGGLSDGVFHDEDVVLLSVCWGVLVLAWLASRYVPAFMRRRTGDA
jgi:hypothetical protein